MELINGKIENFNEIENLKNLENKIEILSTYNVTQIGIILSKLMEQFEGIEYRFEESKFYYNEYNIIPKDDYSNEFKGVYESLTLKTIDRYDLFNIKKEKICILYPSIYKHNNSIKSIKYILEDSFINEYIQEFIDYLYNERKRKKLYEITIEDLIQVLNNFIKLSLSLQINRKKEIKLNINENIKLIKKRNFKQSCLIDRKLIYNSICYVINHYENNLKAIKTLEYKELSSSNWISLNGYCNLVISKGDDKIIYTTLVDSNGCLPDEYYGLNVDFKKNNKICFFDLKYKIDDYIKESYYLKQFMEMIENEFYNNKEITYNHIETILSKLNNEKKLKLKKNLNSINQISVSNKE